MKNSTLAILVVLASLAAYTLITPHAESESETRKLYEEWKRQYAYGMRMTQADDEYRFKIFEQNVKEINEHNAKPNESYTMGINQFTGLSKQEFSETYLTHFDSNPSFNSDSVQAPIVDLNVNWVTYGAVSPVKNEGSCLANYAFSAVGAIEGISVIVYKQQTQYSAQQIVDCTGSYGNSGCNGGTMQNSFTFVVNRGINTQNAYPYVGRVQACQSSSGLFRIKSSGRGNSCPSLDTAIQRQPVSVAVDGQNMVNYRGGIFYNCGTQLSVAALLVGATDSVYTLKFSWGTAWGEAGYIRLNRQYNGGNVCGICQASSFPNA